MKFYVVCGSAFSVLLFATGCADISTQQMGTGIGAIVGGVAGSQISRNNRVVGAVAGAAVGGFVGNRIGKYLTDQDKKRTTDASARTAETGKPQQFRTGSGATVTTTVTPNPAISSKPEQPSPSTTVVTASASAECRTVRQSIVLQNGTREVEDIKMCNGPDGWQPA